MTPQGNLRDIIERIEGCFAYIQLNVPEFPAEDGTDTRKEFACLRELVAQVQQLTKDERKNHWLDLCIQEIGQSLQAYLAGDEDRGLRLLDAASEHFKDSKSGNVAKTTFIADSTGRVKRSP